MDIISNTYYMHGMQDYPSKDSLGFLLADVSRLMRRSYERRVDETGLTLAQARLLVYISAHEGARQVDLAELLEIQPITLARLVDQLVALGLAERRPAPNDRRAHLIHLSAAAQPHLQMIARVAQDIRQHALQELEPEQIAILHHALKSMRSRLCSAPGHRSNGTESHEPESRH